VASSLSEDGHQNQRACARATNSCKPHGVLPQKPLCLAYNRRSQILKAIDLCERSMVLVNMDGADSPGKPPAPSEI
jgi:hypothetical protein